MGEILKIGQFENVAFKIDVGLINEITNQFEVKDWPEMLPLIVLRIKGVLSQYEDKIITPLLIMQMTNSIYKELEDIYELMASMYSNRLRINVDIAANVHKAAEFINLNMTVV